MTVRCIVLNTLGLIHAHHVHAAIQYLTRYRDGKSFALVLRDLRAHHVSAAVRDLHTVMITLRRVMS